jgi:hypothetical protein
MFAVHHFSTGSTTDFLVAFSRAILSQAQACRAAFIGFFSATEQSSPFRLADAPGWAAGRSDEAASIALAEWDGWLSSSARPQLMTDDKEVKSTASPSSWFRIDFFICIFLYKHRTKTDLLFGSPKILLSLLFLSIGKNSS